MIDIRNIEVVTPDLQRQSMIESNYRLRNVCILLVIMLAITTAVYSLNYATEGQNKEK